MTCHGFLPHIVVSTNPHGILCCFVLFCHVMCFCFGFGPVATIMSLVCNPLYCVNPDLFSLYPVVPTYVLHNVSFIIIARFLALRFLVLVSLCSDLCLFV